MVYGISNSRSLDDRFYYIVQKSGITIDDVDPILDLCSIRTVCDKRILLDLDKKPTPNIDISHPVDGNILAEIVFKSFFFGSYPVRYHLEE